MAQRYYSSRITHKTLTLQDLYQKLISLYSLFCGRNYFKEKAGITSGNLPESITHEAMLDLSFQPFPISKWATNDITEDHIFDTLEFLYDSVSKPGVLIGLTDETGWNYYDYDSYDCEEGQREFRDRANTFLHDYKSGFELSKQGMIISKGTDGLQYILDAEIIPYDEEHVDSKVRNALMKWRNRHPSMSERKEAIRELADVFEWLRKTKELEAVLDTKDESALFDIANNFSIRHHNPNQKVNYDQGIWYSWMFHFYLATYHATIRLLKKRKQMAKQISDKNSK